MKIRSGCGILIYSAGQGLTFTGQGLTFTTIWDNLADDILVIYFLFFPKNRIWDFMQTSLQEMSNPVSWIKWKKKISSAESFTRSAN